jgi:tryptophan synthase alpha chain
MSEQRITNLFAQGKALIAYITAGDGGMKRTYDAALALIKGGVNLLEIGVPFSDPIADGPVIQRAAQRSLRDGTNLQQILQLCEKLRKQTDIPIILFSYYNPILTAMQDNFLHRAKLAGVDGILIVDCPIEETQSLHKECLQEQLAPIYIITPSTPLERIHKIDQYGRGFLYYACRKGTTGTRDELPSEFAQQMRTIKTATHLPIAVGFGISNRKMADQVLAYADGVVIGSLFVKALEENIATDALTKLAEDIYPSVHTGA